MSIPRRLFCLRLLVLLIACAEPTRGEAEEAPPTAEQAQQLLLQGNARFVAGESLHPHEKPNYRRLLEAGQHPTAVVIGCSDARTPPELIFDQGLGDIFVVRVAGNVVDTDVAASVEYAVVHLHTKLVVVMGHTHCGAVSATLEHLTDAQGEPAEVVSLLFQIEPATVGLPAGLTPQERVDRAVEQNVKLAVRRLSRIPTLYHSVQEDHVMIVGAVYDMHTGKVRFNADQSIAAAAAPPIQRP